LDRIAGGLEQYKLSQVSFLICISANPDMKTGEIIKLEAQVKSLQASRAAEKESTAAVSQNIAGAGGEGNTGEPVQKGGSW
jgi:hypothetical protein